MPCLPTRLVVWSGIGFLLLILVACSPVARQRAATIASAAAAGAAGTSAPQYLSTKLMVFGGEGHKLYLGCLNCNEYASDSVLNSRGSNGSPYSSQSIWNHFGEFGSRYSTYRACNPYAQDPPVIVDQGGTYYGRLTVNQYNPERGAGARFYDWLTETVCK
jgi:hypothetical protein